MDKFEEFGRRMDEELSRLRRFIEEEVAPETERRGAIFLRADPVPCRIRAIVRGGHALATPTDRDACRTREEAARMNAQLQLVHPGCKPLGLISQPVNNPPRRVARHGPDAGTYEGSLGFLAGQGVDVVLLDDPGCAAAMREFQQRYALVWSEDIGGR